MQPFMKLTTLVLLLCVSSYAATLRAQTTDDTTHTNAAQKQKPSLATNAKPKGFHLYNDGKPVPKTAALLAIVPGLGQAYNKKYWKIPLVYGALYGVYSIYKYNNDHYQRYRTAYLEKYNTGTVSDPALTTLDLNGLKVYRDAYHSDRELATVALILVYLLNGVDAFVDAHLATFSVSEDLSMNLRLVPRAEVSASVGNTFGLGLNLSLAKKGRADATR